jgi:hypothetical protein
LPSPASPWQLTLTIVNSVLPAAAARCVRADWSLNQSDQQREYLDSLDGLAEASVEHDFKCVEGPDCLTDLSFVAFRRLKHHNGIG